jgi:alpha-L-arabinofuranosidase
MKQQKNNQKFGILLFIGAIAINGFSANTLTLTPDNATMVINKLIFSGLMEDLGTDVNNGVWVGTTSKVPNTHGIRNDIIKGFKECGIEGLQWPGGCAANSYVWTTYAKSSSYFGTDRFLELCDSVGCEPYITSPGYSNSVSSNMAWARYINDTAKHTVKYWKVGNEVWGCGGSQSASTYTTNFLANYDSLKQSINGKNLSLVAGTGLIGNWTWLSTMLPGIDGKACGIELHDYLYYPYGTTQVIPCIAFSDSQYYIIISQAYERISDNINTAISYLDTYDKDTSIMIMEDEWGDWLLALDHASNNFFQQITVMDMLSTIIQYHTFMKYSYRVKLAAMAQVVNTIHSLFLTQTSSNSSDSSLVKTPAFYAFKMLLPHHTANAKWVPSTMSCDNITKYGMTMPSMSAAATKDSLGHLNISLCNVDPASTRSLTITISSDTTYSMDTAEYITGPAKNSYNAFDSAEKVNIKPLSSSNYTLSGKTLTVTVPAISAVMLILESQTTGLKSQSFSQNTATKFFMHGAKGRLYIMSSESINKPINVNIYGIDGKTLIDKFSANFEAGKNLCLPSKKLNGNGVYIIKIEGNGVNFAKKIAFTK